MLSCGDRWLVLCFTNRASCCRAVVSLVVRICLWTSMAGVLASMVAWLSLSMKLRVDPLAAATRRYRGRVDGSF